MHRRDADALRDSQRLPRSTAVVDDRRLAYVTGGTGSPAVVFLSGAGMGLDSWFKVYAAVAETITAIAYDRPGVGSSERPTVPQTGDVVVETLRRLLAAAETPPPYVLVGHSLGGLYAELYARRHPDEIAGVVLVDAASPEEALDPPRPGGLARAIGALGSAIDRLRGWDDLGEVDHVPETARQVMAAGPFPSVPLIVLAGGHRMPMVPKAAFDAHLDAQRRRVSLAPDARLVLAERSGHFPHLTEPEVVIEAIKDVVDAARAVTRTT